MTISDQSMPMFQDEDTHRIHRDMSSIGYPCSTIQGSAWYLSLMRPGSVSITSLDQANNPCSTTQAWVGYLSLMRPAVVLLPRWTNVNVIINLQCCASYFKK